MSMEHFNQTHDLINIKGILGDIGEFILLLFIGAIVVFVLTGSFEATWIILVVDVIQNLVVYLWFKLNCRKRFRGVGKWFKQNVS